MCCYLAAFRRYGARAVSARFVAMRHIACLPRLDSKSPEVVRHPDPAIHTEPAGFHGIDLGVSSLCVNADLIPLPGNGHEITGLPSKMSQHAI